MSLYLAVNGGVKLGESIRRARERAGLGQNELAKRAGINQPTLQRIESGRSEDPSVSLVLRIAAALGCTVEELAKSLAVKPPTDFASLAETVSRLERAIEENREGLARVMERQDASIAQVQNQLDELAKRADERRPRRRQAG